VPIRIACHPLGYTFQGSFGGRNFDFLLEKCETKEMTGCDASWSKQQDSVPLADCKVMMLLQA